MAAPTGAALKQLTAKALKAGSKSAGMRQMLDAGVPVAEVAAAFGSPYGFVYGVARRNGNVTSAPRAPKAEKAKTATKTKAAAKPAAKAAPKATAKTTAKAPARAAKPAPKAAAKSAKRTAAKA